MNCHSPDKFSDHSAVACTLNTSIPFRRKPRRKVYLFNKGDYDSLRSELQEFQESFFQSTSEDTDIEEDWKLFKSALKTSVDRNIPSKMVSGRSKLPWLSARLRRLIRRKNRIHAKYMKNGNHRLYTLWRSLRSERNQHLNQVIGDIQTDPKPFWNYIRSQRKDNQVMQPLKTPAGTTIDSD